MGGTGANKCTDSHVNMLSEEQLPKWLAGKNENYRKNDIPPKRRPFLALAELSREFNTSIYLNSDLANKVFGWFTANTKPGAHAIGSLFTGIFYFDACFWPVFIPIGYGTFKLDALSSLETMPKEMKAQLQQDQNEMRIYALYWIDCVDFAYGLDDLRKNQTISVLGKSFLENGEREIESVISQLSSTRPNTKAILTARMAVEIFLKSLLITKGNKNEADIKKIGHDVSDAMSQCFTLTSVKEFFVLKSMLGIFPDVSARYTGSEPPIRKVWEAYCIAQATATVVARILSGRDSRSKIGIVSK